MANRPRRPRSNGAPSLNGEMDEDVGTAASSGPTSDITSGDAAPRSTESLDAPVRPASSALPPLEDQPETVEASADQQRAAEGATAADTLAAPSAGEGLTGPEGFVREEGLSAKAGEPARPHLGEFEDDETIPTEERARPRIAGATDAYAEAGARASSDEPARAGASTGALVGAGLAGAVLALLGGSILAYSGLIPATSDSSGTATQYASAGDLETLSSETATLRATVEQLQSAQAAGGTGGEYASVQDLTVLADRLTVAEQSFQAAAGTDDGSAEALQAAQDGAGTAQSAADAAREAAEQAMAAATGAQETATGARDAATSAQEAADAVGTRLDEQESRLASLEEAGERARLSLAAASLKAAIDRGGGFEPELATFRSAGGAAEDLEPFAAGGVPTRSELLAEWPQAEADLRRAIIQPDADAGVGNQLLAGLSSLVTVRSTDAPAADDSAPDAAIARMGAAVEAGDYDAWLGEYGTLDPAVQTAGEAFAERVRARAEASSIVDSALASAAGGTEG